MYRESHYDGIIIQCYDSLKKITIEHAPVFFPELRGIYPDTSNLEEIDFGDSLIGIYGGFVGLNLKNSFTGTL